MGHIVIMLLVLLLQVLYMDIVKLMPSEVDKVMELLEDKELRLCTPVEEIKLLL